MRLATLTLFACLALFVLPSAAFAQTVPAGTGILIYKEAIKVKGCDSSKAVDFLTLTVNANSTWSAITPSGTFSGTLTPADTKGLKWDVFFDGASQAAFSAFLENEATDLCGTTVTIIGGGVAKFQLKFKKDLSAAAVQLKAVAEGSTIFGVGTGKYGLKAKGYFTPM